MVVGHFESAVKYIPVHTESSLHTRYIKLSYSPMRYFSFFLLRKLAYNFRREQAWAHCVFDIYINYLGFGSIRNLQFSDWRNLGARLSSHS
jgi:hypothetical protein